MTKHNSINWRSLADINARNAQNQKRIFMALDLVHKLPADQLFVIKHLHGLLGCEEKNVEAVAKLMGYRTPAKVYQLRNEAYANLRQMVTKEKI